jgi:ankyrin repeat protein
MKKIITMIILFGAQSAFGMKASKREELNYYLIEAVKKKAVGEVQLLLAQNADPNTRDEKNKTVLMWAALKDSVAIMNELGIRGADGNAVDDQGNTAAMLAAQLAAQNRWSRAFKQNWWCRY